MKDSRVGAMGVFAAIALLLLKITALASLTPATVRLPLLIGMMSARAIPALDVSFFQYARESGTAAAFTRGKSHGMLVLVFFSMFLVSLCLGRLSALILILLPLGVTLLLQQRISKRLGGLTGDVYGMGIECSETLTLLMGCILAKWTFF
jgi:adenosylcobinamide-GDP ribazoletransferase